MICVYGCVYFLFFGVGGWGRRGSEGFGRGTRGVDPEIQ